ncbi:MAG: hypothetical protein GY737_17580, partial [Desulfobacteraceae bacterium]|nr:hypothetical protein [Desulfobacteraceae bacterium]
VYRKHQLQDYIKKKREQFKDDEQELTEFNRLVDVLNTAITFDYIKVLKRVRVRVESAWAAKVILDAQLQHILGMENAEISTGDTLARFPPDLKAGMSNLLVYCNLITPQLVGGTRANLLKVVPLQGQQGDIVAIDFPNIHYGDLLLNRFSTVEISIKASSGDPIEFNYGNVFVKLHLKKRQLF